MTQRIRRLHNCYV